MKKNPKLKDLDVNREARITDDQNVHGRTLRGGGGRSDNESRQRLQFLVGVDEAGRGPLAGPVAVGVVSVPFGFDWETIPGVKDSKKVAPQHRERIYKIARSFKRSGRLDYAVALVSAAQIDRIGINAAVRLGIDRCFQKLALEPHCCDVKLDGLLSAPVEFTFQETIIKGDSKEKVIGLASIIAKVTRDRVMVRHAKKFPQYVFEAHKGYGTELHYEAMLEHGLCPLHRRSFCRKVEQLLIEGQGKLCTVKVA